MSPQQERRATLPKAKPEGRGPGRLRRRERSEWEQGRGPCVRWRGRVKAIGNVDIPQEAFLAILKVDS